MLRYSRRRALSRLLRALRDNEVVAVAGSLPSDTWQWILESRIVFIAKKSAPAPRPIRVSKLLRRISKHALHQCAGKSR